MAWLGLDFGQISSDGMACNFDRAWIWNNTERKKWDFGHCFNQSWFLFVSFTWKFVYTVAAMQKGYFQ